MRNEQPQRKNQDSAGGMGSFSLSSFSLRDLFAHIAIAYGTSFMQTHIALQLSKVFDKLTFFCKTKPILVRQKFTQALL